MRSVLVLLALCVAVVSARTLADADATNVLAADSRIAAVLTDTTAVAANSMARANQRSQAVARQQVQPAQQGKDGGATTLIANKNYMSLMEDEDGNPLPPDASEGSGSSEASSGSGSGSSRSESAKKESTSASFRSASSGSVSASSVSASGSASASAAESGRSETSAAESARSEAASESVTVARVTESAVTESAKPRFRSLHRMIHRTQADEQRAVEAASQQNAIAEVAEAMEGAQKVNARNEQLAGRR